MNAFINSIILNKDTTLFSVGQAGYIIKSKNGELFAIDLYLSECVERYEGHMGFKRMLPKILSPFDIVFDCIVATHPHLDHFDVDSMPQLMSNNKTKLFASVDCKKEVNRLNIPEHNVTYVKPLDAYNCGDFTLRFVSCDHGTGAPDAVGVVVEVDGKRLYFAGDTCLRLDRVDEISQFGKIDVMIAPINGAFGNLNEKDCALLSDAIKPKLTIPSHYGMFASHGGSPGIFYDIMTTEYPNNKFIIMAQGEALSL